jgi:hypothetical protein
MYLAALHRAVSFRHSIGYSWFHHGVLTCKQRAGKVDAALSGSLRSKQLTAG